MSDINRRIAEAQGWRDLYRSSYWYETYDSGPYEIEAWFGTSPDGDTGALVPDYERDLNAAMALVADIPGFSLNGCDPAECGAQWEACFNAGTERDPQYITAYHNHPARAICEAWLALHEAAQAG